MCGEFECDARPKECLGDDDVITTRGVKAGFESDKGEGYADGDLELL